MLLRMLKHVSPSEADSVGFRTRSVVRQGCNLGAAAARNRVRSRSQAWCKPVLRLKGPESDDKEEHKDESEKP
jgi:hypothetical protein